MAAIFIHLIQILQRYYSGATTGRTPRQQLCVQSVVQLVIQLVEQSLYNFMSVYLPISLFIVYYSATIYPGLTTNSRQWYSES